MADCSSPRESFAKGQLFALRNCWIKTVLKTSNRSHIPVLGVLVSLLPIGLPQRHIESTTGKYDNEKDIIIESLQHRYNTSS